MKAVHALLALFAFGVVEGCKTYSTVDELSVSAAIRSPSQQSLVASIEPLVDQPARKLGRLVDAASEASQALKERPDDTSARDDYNFAAARIMDLVQEQDWEPWLAAIEVPSGDGQIWSVTIDPPSGVSPEALGHVDWKAADRLEFRGELIGERSVKPGLGGAVVAIANSDEIQIYDKFSPDEIYYAITCVLYFDERNCRIQLLDPLENEEVELNGETYPLAADFQAPLALSLAELHHKRMELQGFFHPADTEMTERLARLQSYNPEKIPLLFIHGLGNSPATFMPLIDHLRKDRTFRENYQVWYFAYRSGLPYPMAADALDKQLDEFSDRYAGHRKIVLIGHSMGGMIARRLITDSGMAIWDSIYPKPPEEMPFSPGTLDVIQDSIIFEARDDIDRVIFASASHRGSYEATKLLGRLGASVIGDPIPQTQASREAYALARPELVAEGYGRIPNSVNLLDPEGNFIRQMDKLPIAPGIPYHSLIGDRGKGGNLDRTEPVSTDGVVPYWSSHMDGAASELVIPSDHWSHLHPEGMAEIRRILLLHLGEET